MLDSLGLDACEEALYETVLRHPSVSLADLTRLCPDFSSRTAEALVAKGLLRRSETGFLAVAPEPALRLLLEQRRRTLDRAESRIAELDRLHRTQPSQPATSPVELVPGAEAPIRMAALHFEAKQQIRSLETPPYGKVLVPEDTKAALDGLDRGVQHRMVYSRAAIEAQGLAFMTACLGAGEEARVVGDVPVRMTLFDDFAAALPVMTGRMVTEGIVVVRPGSILDSLSALFETIWAGALPFGLERPTDPADGLDDDIFVALLASGMSDHAIARQLDISVRTVGRKIQRVLAEMNAATRFQAGVAIGMGRANVDT
jgi:hypothetical protein